MQHSSYRNRPTTKYVLNVHLVILMRSEMEESRPLIQIHDGGKNECWLEEQGSSRGTFCLLKPSNKQLRKGTKKREEYIPIRTMLSITAVFLTNCTNGWLNRSESRHTRSVRHFTYLLWNWTGQKEKVYFLQTATPRSCPFLFLLMHWRRNIGEIYFSQKSANIYTFFTTKSESERQKA